MRLDVLVHHVLLDGEKLSNGPALQCKVAVARLAKESTTDSMSPPRAYWTPLPAATVRPIAHALSFIRIKEHHFLQAHLRSQLKRSCHSLWSDALTALNPTLVKESSIIADSTSDATSPAKCGIGGILDLHDGRAKASAETLMGLFSFKSHGITCNRLFRLAFQQN